MAKPRLLHPVRDQVKMEALSLDDLVDPDHLARDVWHYVCAMDLGELYDAIRSREGSAGAPCFDPRVLLCLWLYATMDGVGSARRLCELVAEHVVYRWIAGDNRINYHTLASFRSSNEALLDRLLTASLATLAQEGLIDLANATLAHDGVRVRASAGADSLRRRKSLEELLAQAKARVEELKKGGENDPPPTRGEAARQRAARERVERLENALRTMQTIEQDARQRTDRPKQERRISTTDPDATKMRMANGGMNVAHNIQFTVETATRTITGVRIATYGSDTGTLLPAMREHHARANGLPKRVLADGGFFKYSDIAELERGGCEVLMPDKYAGSKSSALIAKADRSIIKQWREKMATEAAKKDYVLRSSTVEYANARVRHQGLRQLTVRGRNKVRSIALLHAIAHNIQRTVALREQASARKAA